MIQEVIGTVYKPFANTEAWLPNITATALSVAAWGYFLYQGVVDPLGGINTLWPLFGISNQMLAGIALIFGTTVLFKMGKKKYTWVTLIPTVLLLVVTLTAGWQKLFHSNPAIGFLSHANKFQEAYNNGEVLAPAKDLGEMRQILFNDYIDAALCAIFMLVVIMVFISAIRIWIKILKNQRLELHESPYIPRENINAGA
jgi:carbon starvation protein